MNKTPTAWETMPPAKADHKTVSENGQEITFTSFSCPRCGCKFGESRGVFGPHATESQLQAIAANPEYGPGCGLYKLLESYPREQPTTPIHSLFTPAPGYERFADATPGVARFCKATSRALQSKGPSGIGVASHAEINRLEAEGADALAVELLRRARDAKDGGSIGDKLEDSPIVFVGHTCATFKCKPCKEEFCLIIF